MEISCAFATALDTPEHVRIAEELGYRRAWLYDSPALYPDVWATLALAAERTKRIGLGPGVLIPSLRHPMVNAAAIAMLAHLAPGRLQVAVGSGFTGRLTMGQRPLKWNYVADYIRTVQALLRGETAEWEGRTIQMMHPDGFAPARPLSVPFVIGAGGPKGNAIAKELGEGLFVPGNPPADAASYGRCIILAFGTILAEGEDPASGRVMAAAGHGGAVTLHAMYERKADMSRLPGGAAWQAAMDALPEAVRHLAIHDGHLIHLTERDAPVVTGDFLRQTGQARTAEGWLQRLAQLEADGATEIAYQPAGPDIPGELERFAKVAGL